MAEEDNDVRVLSIEKLDAPPRERDADKSWWEIVLETDDDQATIHVWVTGTAEVRLPEEPSERDEWVREEIEKLGTLYDIDTFRALPPQELRVPPA